MSRNYSAYVFKEDLDPNEHHYVISAGCYTVDKAEFITDRPNGREDYQLIYVRNGTINIMGEKPYSSGSIILYRPHTPQNYYYSSLPQSEYYWVHFNGADVEGILENLGYDKARFFIGNSAEIATSYNRLINEIKQRGYGFQTFCSSELLHLLALVARTRHKLEYPEIHNKKYLFNTVVDSMHNSGIHTSIEEYAQMCFMSKYRFIHTFKNIMGMPPHAYQQRIVLIKAQDLLQNSKMSVTKISEELGFSDIYYFSRFFKKETGMSPLSYRKSHQ